MARKTKNVSTIKSKSKEVSQAESSVLNANPDAVVAEQKPETIVHVRALIPFYDLESNTQRGAGAEWEVTQNRADLLVKLGIAIVL